MDMTPEFILKEDAEEIPERAILNRPLTVHVTLPEAQRALSDESMK
jgi:hypothetical protein